MLFDAHCHLNELENIEEKIKEAKKNDVKIIFSNSVDLNSSKENLELQEKFSEVKAFLGLHPSNLLSMNKAKQVKAIEFIKENINNAIGIGETGLDFKHADTKEKQLIQKKFFEKQIEIAIKENKLIQVHSRLARIECIELLEKFKAKKVLMHWFYGNKELIERILKNNWFISVGPSILTEKHIQEMIKLIPLENLLLETDAPVIFSGKKAEPKQIKEVAEKVIKIKEINLINLKANLKKNLKKML